MRRSRSSHRITVTAHVEIRSAPSTSFATWSRRCIGRASRSFSTWSSTTPPKAISVVRLSASAEWTTRRTTYSTPIARATRTIPAPATPSTRTIHRPAHDPGQFAVLGRGDARRRLSVRSGVGPGPRRIGQRHAEPAGALGYRVGSGAGRNKADRGGLGCRRPLSGGDIRRGRLEGMERTLPRRCPLLLSWGRRLRPPGGRSPARQPVHLRPQRPRAGAKRQLRDVSRRFHAERSRLLRSETQRREPRRQPRRQRGQPKLELWRRRADRGSRNREAAYPPGKELSRHDAPVGRDAHVADG